MKAVQITLLGLLLGAGLAHVSFGQEVLPPTQGEEEVLDPVPSEPIPAPKRAPAPFPDFQAKRIRPPQSGAGKRITVQIDPTVTPPQAVVAREDGSIAPAQEAARFSWFWEAVGSDLDNASPGRLAEGLSILEGRPEVPQPRLQDLQTLIKTYGITLLTQSAGTEVSPALALAVMVVESGGKADAVSRVGAEGLMQLMPGTAAEFGVNDSFDPTENIAGGIRFLDKLMREFSGDPFLVLAGYNAGAGAVKEHKGVPPFAETRDYVPKVLAAYQLARNLCVTPPVLMSDGCVFQTMK